MPPPPDTYSPAENRALPEVPVIVLLLMILSSIIVGLRIYTRAWLKSVAGWDDILMVPAVIFAMGATAVLMIEIYCASYGRHIATLTKPQFHLVVKLSVVISDLSASSLFCARASICVFVFRIVRRIRPWTILIFVAMVLNGCVLIGNIINFSLNCVPISKIWDSEEAGWCMGFELLDILGKTFGALNCVVDFMCVGIPFVAVWGLEKVNMRTKVGLYALLCGGLITAACSIGRVNALDFHSADQTWDLVPLTWWSAAEMFGAMTFGSLPALSQLFKYYKEHRTFRKLSNSATYQPESSRRYENNRSAGSEGDDGIIQRTTDVYVELSSEPLHSHQVNFAGSGYSFEHK